MTADLEKAVQVLRSEELTLAAICGEKAITSRERGVKPLLQLLDGGSSLAGFSAADKVIGKAAAFLYVLLEPDCIYADVISRPALEVLKNHDIPVNFSSLADGIRNRTNTGFCPMETAVMDADSPEDALILIRKKLAELAKGGAP